MKLMKLMNERNALIFIFNLRFLNEFLKIKIADAEKINKIKERLANWLAGCARARNEKRNKIKKNAKQPSFI